MTAVGLTTRQADLLRFIQAHVTRYGTAPTYLEMCDALGLVSKSGVHRLVLALEERGHIRRMPNRRRAIELVRSAADIGITILPGGGVEVAFSGEITADWLRQHAHAVRAALDARVSRVLYPPRAGGGVA